MILRRLLRMAFYSDLNPIRIILALSEMIYAVAFFWPGETITRQPYHHMRYIMSTDEAWGLLFLTSAVLQSYILLSAKYHSHFAVTFAFLNATLWWVASLTIYTALYPPAAGMSGEIALAMGATWVFSRSGWTPVGGRENVI